MEYPDYILTAHGIEDEHESPLFKLLWKYDHNGIYIKVAKIDREGVKWQKLLVVNMPLEELERAYPHQLKTYSEKELPPSILGSVF